MSSIISAHVFPVQEAFSTQPEQRTRRSLPRARSRAAGMEVLQALDTFSTFPGGLNKTSISQFNTPATRGSTVPGRTMTDLVGMPVRTTPYTCSLDLFSDWIAWGSSFGLEFRAYYLAKERA